MLPHPRRVDVNHSLSLPRAQGARRVARAPIPPAGSAPGAGAEARSHSRRRHLSVWRWAAATLFLVGLVRRGLATTVCCVDTHDRHAESAADDGAAAVRGQPRAISSFSCLLYRKLPVADAVVDPGACRPRRTPSTARGRLVRRGRRPLVPAAPLAAGVAQAPVYKLAESRFSVGALRINALSNVSRARRRRRRNNNSPRACRTVARPAGPPYRFRTTVCSLPPASARALPRRSL